jgi:hypothetical protein
MRNGVADPVIWTPKTRGWHWTGPDGWEIVRDVDSHTDRTRFGVWHGTELIDFCATFDSARLAAESEMTREPLPRSPYAHRYAGSDPARQGIGDPGHCDDCARVGHIVAHSDLGCGDVGCISDHEES